MNISLKKEDLLKQTEEIKTEIKQYEEEFLNISNLFLTDKDLKRYYISDKISYHEETILRSLSNYKDFLKLLQGSPKFLDKTLNKDEYFTNTQEMLQCFYSLYKKFPDLNIDKIFEFTLETMSKNRIYLYYYLTYIVVQIENEKNKTATFTISKESLKNTKQLLDSERIKKYLSNVKLFSAKNKENGYLEVFAEYNEIIKKHLNISIL
ncbi:MAG: hypothetical protein ACI4XM_03905 [Candidatus Coprovivens sp.]